MPLVLNYASICTVGSVGQKGGSLMLTAARVGRRAGAAAASEVAMIEFAGRELAGV